MLTATDILEIPEDAPECLYHGDAAEIVKQYRILAMRWHPDRPENHGSTEAGSVFRKVVALKRAAEALMESGNWFASPGQTEFVADNGQRHSFRYRAHRVIDVGHVLIDEMSVAFLFRTQHADLFANALSAAENVRFADIKMEAEFGIQLPRLTSSFRTPQYKVMVLQKDPEAIRLADLLKHIGGKLPAVHVAWLMSRCLNLACWFEWAGLFHGDFSSDSLYVNPRLHSVSLLGGWQYSTRIGEPLKALPRRSAELLPSDVLGEKLGNIRGDLESIRALGRELLGDPVGTCLGRNPDVPSALVTWALQAGGPTAFHDFQGWSNVLRQAFGARRFVQLSVAFDEVYSSQST
jgi:hypothetical protein